MPYMSKRQTKNQGVVPIGSNLFGYCNTNSSAQTKLVKLPDFNVLVEGVTVHIYFQHENQALYPLLEVGMTAAKAVYYNGTQGGVWKAGSLISFTYHNECWVQNDVHIDDNDTTYSLSISGHTITLTLSSGTAQSVTVPDNDTTYSLSINGDQLTLTPSSGNAQSVMLPDNDTTYSLSINGRVLTLTPSSGTAQSVTVPGDSFMMATTYDNAFSVPAGTMDGANNTFRCGWSDLRSVNIAQSGYVPLGIIGLTFDANSGSNQTRLSWGSWYLSGDTAYYRVKNISTNTNVVARVGIDVLYLSTT